MYYKRQIGSEEIEMGEDILDINALFSESG